MGPTTPPGPDPSHRLFAPGETAADRLRTDHYALLMASPIALIELDRAGTVLAYNLAAQELFGFPAAEVLGCALPATIGSRTLDSHLPDLMARLEQLGARRTPATLSVRYRHPTGPVLRIELRLAPLYDHGGHVRGVAAVCVDVSRTHRREQSLRRAPRATSAPSARPAPAMPATAAAGAEVTTSDTGNTIKTAALARLADMLAAGAESGSYTGLVLVTVASYWRGSDLLGRADADAVLQQIAPRLVSGAVRGTDVIAPTGRDEFAVLLPGVDEVDTVLAVADRVQAMLQRPFPLDDGHADLTVSLAVAVAPEDGDDAAALFAHARDGL